MSMNQPAFWVCDEHGEEKLVTNKSVVGYHLSGEPIGTVFLGAGHAYTKITTGPDRGEIK